MSLIQKEGFEYLTSIESTNMFLMLFASVYASGNTHYYSSPDHLLFLPALNLPNEWNTKCYRYLLYGNPNFTRIAMFALNNLESNLNDAWLPSVADGVIYKDKSITLPTNCIPSGWTVQDA